MISINIPKFQYPNDRAIVLEDIHINLHAGQITTVLGPSGCGKSTLLRILMGFETSPQYIPAHIFSLVPQTPHLFPWKTVFDNIAMNGENKKKQTDKKLQKMDITHLLSIVGLSGCEGKYPFEISVGMSQRVSFARAMLRSFEALLLDEPFSSLDALTRRELQDWLLKLIEKQNNYALFVTHDISEALYLSKSIYILSKKPGKIAAHFIKEDNCFINKITSESFDLKNRDKFENTIFNLLKVV